jgi:hypothetical protein
MWCKKYYSENKKKYLENIEKQTHDKEIVLKIQRIYKSQQYKNKLNFKMVEDLHRYLTKEDIQMILNK